jgi:hypothetical protein
LSLRCSLAGIFFIAAGLFGAVLVGCGASATQPGTGAAPQVHYEVHGPGSLTSGQCRDGTFTVGDNTLVFQAGNVTANGKECGSVNAGDQILLDAQGRLFVNGKERPRQ